MPNDLELLLIISPAPGVEVWSSKKWKRNCPKTRTITTKAVMLVHNETATGTTSKISEVRKAMNQIGHPALLMVDAVSSLGSIDYRHDEWEVDVMVASSQKGLMLPPGLAFNAISEKALAAGKTAKLPRSYWDWKEILQLSRNGFFPTPRRST